VPLGTIVREIQAPGPRCSRWRGPTIEDDTAWQGGAEGEDFSPQAGAQSAAGGRRVGF